MSPFPKPSALQKAYKLFNPQLPLNPRQSQQLLQTLRTSFQNRLDQTHPPLEQRNEVQSSNRDRFSSSIPGEQKHTQYRMLEPRYTKPVSSAELLSGVLANPLFSTPADPNSFIFGGPTPLPRFTSVPDVKFWFKGRVAAGQMDARHIEHFLSSVHKLMPCDHGLEAISWLKSSAFSRDILAGLPLKALVKTSEFGSSPILCQLLVNCLIAENRTDDIQLMLLETMQFHTSGWTEMCARCKMILKSWLNSSFNFEIGYEQVLKIYCNFLNTSKGWGDLSTQKQRRIFHNTTNRLAMTISTCPSIHPDLYLEFCSVLSQWTGPGSLAWAYMCLYHPINPDASATLLAIEKLQLPYAQKLSTTARQSVLQLCLNAAQRLSEEGKLTNSGLMLEHTKRLFPRELGENVEASNQEGKVIEALRNALSRGQRDFQASDNHGALAVS